MNINDLIDKLYKPESKIYNYCKEHPSAAITVVSLGMTACSAFVNLVLFFSDQLYLREWGWSMSEIDWTPSGLIYNILIGLGLNIAICFIQIAVIRRFEEARFSFYSYWCTAFILNKQKQELIDLKKAGIIVKKGYTKITVSDLIEESKRNKKGLTRRIFREAIFLVRDSLPSIIIIIALAYFFFSRVRDGQSQIIIGLSVLYPILLLFFMVGFNVIREKRKIKKQLNKEGDINLLDVEYNFEVERIEREKRRIQSKSTYSFLFYDDNVILFIRTLLVSMVAILLSGGLLLSFSKDKKRDVSVCKYNDESYMITYLNNEMAYLNKIDILTGEAIVVNTSVKRISRTGDLKYETKQFEKIIRK